MALFEWSKEYELDIPQIDQQHRELVNMINTLYDSIKEGRSAEAVGLTLNRLLQYVEVHFDTEERAMQDINYPDFEDHQYTHEYLREKVLELKKEQLQGREIATFELLNFLVDWLKNHIANVDMAFGQYLHQQDRCNLA